MSKSTATRDKLLETAIELIWQSNYSNVGVAEICKQAGLTKGSFYHYFDSKADLFYEACMYHWQIIRNELDQLFSPTHSPLDQLESVIDFIIEMQLQQATEDNPVSGCPFFTSGAQCGCDEPKIRLAAMEMSDKAVAYNTALIRQLKAENCLNGDPEAQQLGRLLHQYIQGLMMYGRIYQSLEAVKQDLREGMYRLVDLKAEYRRSTE